MYFNIFKSISAWNKLKGWADYEFYRDELRLARGQMKTVCCRFQHGEKMRSVEIPDAVREKFEDLSGVSDS